MQYLAIGALAFCFLCGCSNDATKPAPNYNPAAEREDYPEPAGSDTRPAETQDQSRPAPRGSGSVFKDFKNLDEEKFRKDLENAANGDQPTTASEAAAETPE